MTNLEKVLLLIIFVAIFAWLVGQLHILYEMQDNIERIEDKLFSRESIYETGTGD